MAALRAVGDPVDVVTGEWFDRCLDARLDARLPFEWFRHTNSRWCGVAGPLGYGHRHEFQRRLRFVLDGVEYTAPDGRTTLFPFLEDDGGGYALDGLTLRRQTERQYALHQREQAATLFEFVDPDAPARLTRITTGVLEVRPRYDRDGRIESIRDALGRVIRFEHDAAGRIGALHWGDGERKRVLVAYKYDPRGDLVEGTDAYGHPFYYGYDDQHRVIRKTDRRGFSFHFEYDADGRCVRTRGDDGALDVRLRYLGAERATLVTNADGGQWTYLHDEHGTLTQIIDPYGGRETLKGGGRSTEQRSVDNSPLQRALRSAGIIGYDRRLHAPPAPPRPAAPVPRRYANSNPMAWEWGARLIPIWDLPAATPVLPAAIPAAVRDAFVSLEHDPRAPYAGGRDATGAAHPQFDVAGVLLAQAGTWGGTRRWHYDANGNVERYTDADGGVWRAEYASWNHRTRAVDPLGNRTRFEFDASERLTSATDPGGTRHELAYDLKGRLVAVHYAGKLFERYEYDLADNLVLRRDGRGAVLEAITIGEGNRVASRRVGEGAACNYRYGSAGQLSGAEHAGHVYQFTSSYADRFDDLRDGRGVVHRRESPRGRSVIRSTVLDRFEVVSAHIGKDYFEVTDPTGATHRLRGLDAGQGLLELANGTREFVQYGTAGRCLVKALFRDGTESTPWIRRYHYSGEGDLRSTADSQRGETRYHYDAAHRLTGRTRPDGREDRYAYDAAGNLLSQPGLDAVTLRDNQLQTVGHDRIEYDARLRIASRTGPAGVMRYGYDGDDRLVRVDGPQGVWEAEYDPLGRRVAKTFNGARTTFYWDGERLAAEVAPDGRLRIYVYVDHKALVPLLFIDYASVDAEPSSGARSYLFCDQLGTPVLVQDDAGRTVWRAEIAPYGRAEVESGEGFAQPIRFPGHYHDPEIGLHYNRHRCYSPELGRYLQPDPLGIVAGLNVFAYPAAPLSRVDLDGLTCDERPPPTPEESAEAARALIEQLGERIHDNPDPPDYPGRRPFRELVERDIRRIASDREGYYLIRRLLASDHLRGSSIEHPLYGDNFGWYEHRGDHARAADADPDRRLPPDHPSRLRLREDPAGEWMAPRSAVLRENQLAAGTTEQNESGMVRVSAVGNGDGSPGVVVYNPAWYDGRTGTTSDSILYHELDHLANIQDGQWNTLRRPNDDVDLTGLEPPRASSWSTDDYGRREYIPGEFDQFNHDWPNREEWQVVSDENGYRDRAGLPQRPDYGTQLPGVGPETPLQILSDPRYR